MPTFGVNVAIINEQKEILLTKREDFEVWCLPGGSIEDNESLAQAARREIKEEIGLEIEILGLVGIYSRPNWNQGGAHEILFSAKIVGGTLLANKKEVIEVQYFSWKNLPSDIIIPWHIQRIKDVLNNKTGGVYTQERQWPMLKQNLTRKELYEMRDQSGLSRNEFWKKYMSGDEVKTKSDI